MRWESFDSTLLADDIKVVRHQNPFCHQNQCKIFLYETRHYETITYIMALYYK